MVSPLGGTEGSNALSSSGESGANLIFRGESHRWRRGFRQGCSFPGGGAGLVGGAPRPRSGAEGTTTMPPGRTITDPPGFPCPQGRTASQPPKKHPLNA